MSRSGPEDRYGNPVKNPEAGATGGNDGSSGPAKRDVGKVQFRHLGALTDIGEEVSDG